MLVVVAGGERAEAILLLASKCSFREDERASAALRFLVRGGIVKAVSAKERGKNVVLVESSVTVARLRSPDERQGFG